LNILENLLRVRVLKNAILVKEYGFQEKEVAVLKFLTKNFVNGNNNGIPITEIFSDVLSAKSLTEKLNEIQVIKELAKKGYIEVGASTFFPFEVKSDKADQPTLEMLHSSVTLSNKFLFLLEGKKEQEVSTEPYENGFEYVENKFKKLLLYLEREDLETIENDAKEIDRNIEERVQKTKVNLPLKDIFEKNKFDFSEELVFLAVLSEEYSYFPTGRNLRSIDNLIELISLKNYEKFKNRSLFRDKSKLMKSRLFDIETSIHYVNDQKSFSNEELFVTEKTLKEIEGDEVSEEEDEENYSLLEKLVEEGELFELVKPKEGLDQVILPDTTKNTLDTIVKQLDKKVINRLKKWGIRDRDKGVDARIIFHGVPGTGKTMTAVALAKTLEKELLHFDCSKVLSMYVGESEKNVRNIFDSYKNIVKETGIEPVLFLNEADQFLTSRSTDTSSSVSQMYNQMQNIFLEQIEKFDGVLIATTNILENLDKAFSRRFNYKVEFKIPNEAQRLSIWKKHIPQNAPYEKEFNIEELAKFKLTGGQIDLIVKNTAFHVAIQKRPIFKLENFKREIEREIKSSFDSQKVMGFLGSNH
jgi:SpoVK/Ycf46/Vps4 family AAA+-type ATPase